MLSSQISCVLQDVYGVVLGIPCDPDAEVHPAKDASPTLNYCSAAQELMCQDFGVNMKWQTLRLPILAISTALRYYCLKQKLN